MLRTILFKLFKYWYQPTLSLVTICLLPLAWLFSLISAIRRWLYRKGYFKSYRFPVPVIVVGNIAIGGTGKTPFVIALVKFLQSQGYQPGVVSRGFGGEKQFQPVAVTKHTSTKLVGDEAVLLSRNTQCPVVVCIDRPKAVETILRDFQCDIVISDDGLQHYALARDIEIIIVDAARGFGNGQLIPAGPLRESKQRMKAADFIVMNGGSANDQYSMSLAPKYFQSLVNNTQHLISDFPTKKIHAVAGIGNPDRFFNSLRKFGFDIIEHPFPDHYRYQASDFNFADDYPIIMTEKDAVKCDAFATDKYWYMSIDAAINDKLFDELFTKLKTVESQHHVEEDFTQRRCHVYRRTSRDGGCESSE